MNIAFEKLFEIQQVHEYFPDGVCRPLQLLPSCECQSFLRLYGLRFRPLNGGGAVYFPATPDSGENSQPILPIDEETRFTFALIADDLHFLNYTNLPFTTPGDSCYYFSNLHDSAMVDDFSLQLGNQGLVTAFDSVLLRPKFFAISAPAGPEKITVLDRQDRLVDSVVTPLAGEKENYQIDLRAHKSGLYTLHFSEGETSIYYVDDGLYQQKVFGVVDLFASKAVAEENQFVDIRQPEIVTPKTYSIHYEKRATFWRYYVIPRALEPSDVEKLRVFHEKGLFGFHKMGEACISGGENAVVFQSDDPIPLEQTPVKNLTLQFKRSGSEFQPLIEHLPAPKVTSIQIDPASGTVYSDVFVYI